MADEVFAILPCKHLGANGAAFSGSVDEHSDSSDAFDAHVHTMWCDQWYPVDWTFGIGVGPRAEQQRGPCHF